MTLEQYIAKELVGRNKGRTEGDRVYKTSLLKELAVKCGVSLLTLQSVEKGAKLKIYTKAKAISEATGGKVKVGELCE